ncbi:M50 family metallopeptidase [Actinocorallia sp. API 0066]|uniref:M50 family metallopeptidase n=1 Tax=Actinocorallia sp. API 0066 TaxID=2896846 RepID=UPI0027E0D83C|nr:M50 family metallopeptidase [Actinocorallia sp. API 0066]
MNDDRRPPGIPLGKILGVPLYISLSWFPIALLITLFFLPAAQRVAPQPAATLLSASFALLLYLSVLIHELGHALTARAFGLPVRAIVLHLLGGVTQLEREATRPGASFTIAVAGPLLSLGLGGAGAATLLLTQPGPIPTLLLQALTFTNLVVGVFNLLPGLPLDGGFVIRALVWKITGHDRTGTVVAAHTGRALAALVLLGGIWLATRTTTGTDWITIAWSAFLASFMWIAATQSLRAERLRDRLPLLTARRLARRAAAVTADTPLTVALHHAQTQGAGALIIIDGHGRPTALVSEHAAQAVPEPRRPWTTAGEVARGLDAATTLSADITGEDLLRAVQHSGATEHLLLEPGGEIYGVLSATDLHHTLTTT